MRSDAVTRVCRALMWLCLVVGVVGYAVLVGLLPLPLGGGLAERAGWLARFAPVWLALWLLAAAVAGGVAWRRRGGERARARAGTGSAAAGGVAEKHHCPVCGRPLSLRRARDGARKGLPEWVCDEHGPVP